MLHAENILIGRNVNFGEANEAVPAQQLDFVFANFDANGLPFFTRTLRLARIAISTLLGRRNSWRAAIFRGTRRTGRTGVASTRTFAFDFVVFRRMALCWWWRNSVYRRVMLQMVLRESFWDSSLAASTPSRPVDFAIERFVTFQQRSKASAT